MTGREELNRRLAAIPTRPNVPTRPTRADPPVTKSKRRADRPVSKSD